MTNRRLISRRLPRRPRARRAAAGPARARRRSSASHVRQRRSNRRRRAGRPTSDPSDFIVREDNVAREVLDVGPADDPMQIALLVDNSQAARDDIRDIREALPRVRRRADRRAPRAVKNEIALIALGERPTILADYTTDRATLAEGHRPHLRRMPRQRQPTCSTASSRSARGFKKRGAAAPGDRRASRPKARSSATATTTRCSSRCATAGAAFHAIVDRPAVDRHRATRSREPRHRARRGHARPPAAAATTS